MIAKKSRLTTKEFTEAFTHGKRFNGKDMQLIHTPGETLKVAVVVGGKVTKSKPVRNTMRRRVYSIMREMYGNSTGTYIFLLQKGALDTSHGMLAQTLSKLLSHIA